MAKKKQAEAPKIDFFANAIKKAAETPKKVKGTTIQLPKELDATGKLIGESALLNNSVTDAIEAGAEEKAAKNKGSLAKGRLANFAMSRIVELYANLGVAPPTPLSIVNHNGESVTYIMADKSQQNPLQLEQVELLNEILGEDGAAKIVHEKTTIFFNNSTMEQQAANAADKTVYEVVCEIVSTALSNECRLSDSQKASLIQSTVKTFLRPNTINRAAELCGADAARIGQFFDAVGTACVRSIKV
jgi:hypothetical protein